MNRQAKASVWTLMAGSGHYRFAGSFPRRRVVIITMTESKEKGPRNGLGLSALARMVTETSELRDAYSALLSGVRLNTRTNSGNAILITSTRPNEGKTTVAACLAITASLAGENVLLIDGDLRQRWLGSAAGIGDAVGLGEILGGGAGVAEAVHPVTLFGDSQKAGAVSVIAAGQKSPEFLAAVDWPRVRLAVQSLSQRFGMVLLDSPPILAVNDALLLAGIVNGVLLVVGAGSADRDELRRAKVQLESIGTPVIGAVLNRFDPRLHGRSNQPYRGYYRDTRA
jgi:capsular exopolysaccharide synthesis family protein